MIERIFFVYVDRTDDGRVFYVGKGLLKRVASKRNRNKHWEFICAKHGFIREVVVATKSEQFAFELEIALIKQYKTFEADWPDGSGWGANYTRGGDGMSGRFGALNPQFGKKHSEEAKKAMSLQRKGKKSYKRTPEIRLKISEAYKGEKHPRYGIKGKDNPNYGKKRSNDICAKMSVAFTGEKNPRAKIKESDVLEIRKLYATNLYSYREIGKIFGISITQTSRIIKNESWNEMYQ